jgi:hypothetical protein
LVASVLDGANTNGRVHGVGIIRVHTT